LVRDEIYLFNERQKQIRAIKPLSREEFVQPFSYKVEFEMGTKGISNKVTNKINEPKTPLYSNVTAQPYSGDYKALIKSQVISPVQWQKTIENLVAEGVDTFIEVGVGKTLSGLIKKINADVRVFNVENKETLEALSL